MTCKEIQDILLTDYLDGQLDKQSADGIERHLSDCLHCREFLAAARKSLVAPFLLSEKVSLPQEEVWKNIKQRIEERSSEKLPARSTGDIFAKWRELIFIPQPALVLSLAVALILAGSLYFRSINEKAAETSSSENIQDLAYLTDESTVNDVEEESYGTDIEQYFL